jgi:hypothetical protein
LVLAAPTQTGTSIVNDLFGSNLLVAHMRKDTAGRWRLISYTQIGATTYGEENSRCR